MDILGNLHTIHRGMEGDIGKGFQLSALEAGEANHLVPQLPCVLHRVQDVWRIAAAGDC